MEKKGRKREQKARTAVEVFFGTVVVGGAAGVGAWELGQTDWQRDIGRWWAGPGTLWGGSHER